MSGTMTTMAVEAQRIMAVSLKKIVESRSRRGGVSLHRNLLIAGVLFKARDVMLAESLGRTKQPEVAPASGNECRPTPMDDDEPAATASSENVTSSEDAVAVVTPVVVDRKQSAESETSMDWSAETRSSPDGKENIPPTVSTSTVSDVISRGIKRQHTVVESDSDVMTPVKSPRLDVTSTLAAVAASPEAAGNREPEIHSGSPATSPSRRCKQVSGNNSSVAPSVVKKRASAGHHRQPVLCLPRVDVKSTSSKSTSCWNSLVVRPIFVVQVV